MARIAIVHQDLIIGGAERLIVDAALCLQQAGHDVTIYTCNHPLANCFPETRTQLKVKVVGSWIPRSILGKCHLLCATVRVLFLAVYLCLTVKRRFDLLLADQITFHLPLLKRLCARKVLFYCHFPDKFLVQSAGRRSGGFLHLNIYRRVFDWAEGVFMAAGVDRIVVNSRFTQDAFHRAFPRIRKTPAILYPGVAIPDSEVGESKCINDGSCCCRRFLSLNRFERKKNVELAIEGLAAMHAKEARLVIAGGFDPSNRENAEYLRELETLCDSLGMTHSRDLNDQRSRVTFATSVDEQTKDRLLRSSLALLYTPQNEHFGIVPVEAMSRGLPVIAMKSGGPMETVVHGRSGWLCSRRDPGEMAALMDEAFAMKDDERKLEEMQAFSKDRAREMFSLAAFSEKLTSIVQEMLK